MAAIQSHIIPSPPNRCTTAKRTAAFYLAVGVIDLTVNYLKNRSRIRAANKKAAKTAKEAEEAKKQVEAVKAQEQIKKLSEDKELVTYPQKVAAVTCGLEAVFYDGDICLGGGVIEQVFASGKDMNENIEIKLKEARNV